MKKIAEEYENLIQKYGFCNAARGEKISKHIRNFLKSFMDEHENVAIWCYGQHTKMLMADYVNELRKVKFIIDENGKGSCGYQLITKEQIKEKDIKAVIISSYVYRMEIKDILNREFPEIAYLDIYECLEEIGIQLREEYYAWSHPYSRYLHINSLQTKIDAFCGDTSLEEKESVYFQLINELLGIKSFVLAAKYAKELYCNTLLPQYQNMSSDITRLFELELETAEKISKEHVLMFCIDGLREKDINQEQMPRLYQYYKQVFHFTSARSTSTSTYESLIPVYSQNNDMRTKYYLNNIIPEEQCSFVCHAIEQDRAIHFYTDANIFVQSEKIIYARKFQTATEKIWDFICDASTEEKGLYYLHLLFESHYSYPNPYVKGAIVCEGTNVFFNYLPLNGGKLYTDYVYQHEMALRYIDDCVIPFLEKLRCRILLFADHGNIVLHKKVTFKEITELQLSYHSDLIKIPIAIISPEMQGAHDSGLISLMELPNIVNSLMDKCQYKPDYQEYVKVQRSALYNPDFHYLYKEIGYEYALNAFEAFIFEDGYVLAVFENGLIQLSKDDRIIKDEELEKRLYRKIQDKITLQ